MLGTDLLGSVTYLNPVAERMTGWTHDDAVGQPLARIFRVIDAVTREPAPGPTDRASQLDNGATPPPNRLLVRRDGLETPIEDSVSPIRDRVGEPIGAVIVFKDVGEAQATARLAAYVAQHDLLTGLPNRTLLSVRLTQAIAMARRHDGQLAVTVPRSRSVQPGERQPRLRDWRHADAVGDTTPGRVPADDRHGQPSRRRRVRGGAVEIDHPGDAAAGAQKIIAALAAPHEVARHQLHITATVGISIYPADGADAETLIKCADTAMHNAKEAVETGINSSSRK